MTVYADFNLRLLKIVHHEVKALHPGVDLRSFLGVTRSGRTYFVEGHDASEHIHIRWSGRAEDAAHAKYLAWSAYLSKRKPDPIEELRK